MYMMTYLPRHSFAARQTLLYSVDIAAVHKASTKFNVKRLYVACAAIFSSQFYSRHVKVCIIEDIEATGGDEGIIDLL